MDREKENFMLISRTAERCGDTFANIIQENYSCYKATVATQSAKQFKRLISKHFIVLCEIESSIFATFHLLRPIWQVRFNPEKGSSNDVLIFESQDKKELASKLEELMVKHKEGYNSVSCQVSFDNGENFKLLAVFAKCDDDFTKIYCDNVSINKKKIVW